MGIKDALNKNPSLTTIAVVLVLAGAGYLISRNLTGGAEKRFTNPKWMFDLNTRQLVVADGLMVAPYRGDSGSYDYGKLGSAGALVDAQVYSCGDPADIEAGMTIEQLDAVGAWIGHLLRSPVNDPAAALESGDPAQTGRLTSVLVSDPDGQAWHGEGSTRGRAVIDAGFRLCEDGSLPARCRP